MICHSIRKFRTAKVGEIRLKYKSGLGFIGFVGFLGKPGVKNPGGDFSRFSPINP
jgi:hypothetical protein